jgi:hypothetical protein
VKEYQTKHITIDITLYTYETTKLILLLSILQFIHLLLSSQGTGAADLKVITTRVELSLTRGSSNFYYLVISITIMAPHSSAMKADFMPTFLAKQHKNSALWFLKMPTSGPSQYILEALDESDMEAFLM